MGKQNLPLGPDVPSRGASARGGGEEGNIDQKGNMLLTGAPQTRPTTGTGTERCMCYGKECHSTWQACPTAIPRQSKKGLDPCGRPCSCWAGFFLCVAQKYPPSSRTGSHWTGQTLKQKNRRTDGQRTIVTLLRGYWGEGGEAKKVDGVPTRGNAGMRMLSWPI